MKKILNSVDTLITEMCQGMVSAHPDLITFNSKYKIIERKHLNKDKVSLITGGGSGHEPCHAGYVGKGMLDAVACGEIFSSPSVSQVYNAILDTKSNKGTLLIIKNYSGDCMNFKAAAEMAAEDDGIRVERVYINDDVAVQNSTYTIGRRGVAGTVFVHKIIGAAAERGDSLDAVKAVAEKVIANVRSIGFASSSCTVPAKGSPTLQLGDDEIEFGVGIHGEPGVARTTMLSADALAAKLLEHLFKDSSYTSGEIAVLVNGFGATPLQELYVLNNAVQKILRKNNIAVYKTWVGNYMTALDMAGASLTLLKLDAELKTLLDSPAETPGLKV